MALANLHCSFVHKIILIIYVMSNEQYNFVNSRSQITCIIFYSDDVNVGVYWMNNEDQTIQISLFNLFGLDGLALIDVRR